MPELPEVENTRQYLIRSGLIGRRLGAPEITWANTVREPSVGEFIEGVAGRRVADVQGRGKYLIAPLDDEQRVVLHLGMTGRLRIHDGDSEPPRMVRHTFPLDDGREMRFIDPRKFGHLWLLSDPADAMSKMGPEPLEPSYSVEMLADALAGRKAPLKALLLSNPSWPAWAISTPTKRCICPEYTRSAPATPCPKTKPPACIAPS